MLYQRKHMEWVAWRFGVSLLSIIVLMNWTDGWVTSGFQLSKGWHGWKPNNVAGSSRHFVESTGNE